MALKPPKDVSYPKKNLILLVKYSNSGSITA